MTRYPSPYKAVGLSGHWINKKEKPKSTRNGLGSAYFQIQRKGYRSGACQFCGGRRIIRRKVCGYCEGTGKRSHRK